MGILDSTTWKRKEQHSTQDLRVQCDRLVERYYNGVHYPPAPYASASYLKRRFEHWTVGYNIAHFRELIRTGKLVPHTPFWQLTVEGESTAEYDLTYTTQYGWERYFVSAGELNYNESWVIGYDDVAPYLPQHDTSMCQTAAGAIYTSGHDTLTFLAEFTSLRKMFLSTATKIAKFRFPKNWKNLSSEWLGARYGWRTLLYDLDDLSRVVANIVTRNKKPERHKKWVGYETDLAPVSSEWVVSGTPSMQYRMFDTVRIGSRGSVSADIDVPDFRFNPLLTGWEVIPFSFVLDWFIGVGQSIAAASFQYLATASSASTGCYAEMTRTLRRELIPTSSIFGKYFQDAWCKVRVESRKPCNVSLTPQFRLNLNPLKILDLIGLIIQKKGR